MRVPLAFMLLAALLAPALVSAEQTSLQIVELLPAPADGEREFIELWNPLDHEVDLTGWTISDAANNSFVFPQWIIPPGARVVVWGGGEGDGRGPAWSKSAVWNNGGDTALLRNAAGQLVQQFTYGTGGDAPVPPAGESLQWDEGWSAGTPTPGQPPGTEVGGAGFSVENVPPTLEVTNLPLISRPGQQVTSTFVLDDANGDPINWRVLIDGVELAAGTSVEANEEREVTAPAPQQEGDWIWQFEADDGTNSVAETRIVSVRLSDLRIEVPPGGIPFPALAPGATNVAAQASFTVHNDGNQTIVPRLDLSPFRGPAEVAVDGNVQLLIDGAQGVAYNGPLTQLPALAGGENYAVTMVLLQLPVPLPAGAYGTTFTVSE